MLTAFAVFLSSAIAQTSTTTMVAMRDGVELATDIYLPAGPGSFPVLLIRTPYGKGAMRAGYEDLVQNVAVGAVVQDTRGRFDSQGVDCIFRCELGDGLGDGADTIAWVRGQSWSNGSVATQGGSALGIVQYLQAVGSPEGLTAMSVSVATPMLYDHGMFQGGVFRQAMIEGWLQGQNSAFFLQDVIQHPLAGPFWDPVQIAPRYGQVNVPAVHLGGWYDIFAQGTIDAFVGFQHSGGPNARGKQKLVMGPWTHGGWRNGQQGELTYPPNGAEPADAPNFESVFLSHYLGLAVNQAAVDAIPVVQYYVMGDVDDPNAPGNEWRSADDWPVPAAPIRFYLQPGGGLAEACPPSDGGSTSYRYDPADPSPTIGGANLILPAGPMDQGAVEARSDVILFETPPLSTPIEITGRIRAHLFASTDTVDTDLVVRLTDVYPDGRSMLVLDGPARMAARGRNDTLELLTPGTILEVLVDLWSTSIILARNHRLRISVSSANAPRFWPNPNDGSSYGGGGTAVPAQVLIHHALAHASYIELPDPSRSAGEVVLCSVPTQDAGIADSGSVDGGTTKDAGSSADSDDGCGCSSHRPTLGGIWPLLLLFVLWSHRWRIS